MYIDIGNEITLSTKNIVAIIGYSKRGSEINKNNEKFLSVSEQGGEVIDISGGRVNSIILTNPNRVYLSALSNKTLVKRYLNNGLNGGEKQID